MQIDDEIPQEHSSYRVEMEARLPADMLERARQRKGNEASKRNPYMHWRSNTADRIEKQLHRDGHRTWGFVIYRTCYDSDEDWKEFLRRLWMHTKDEINWRCDGADILDLCKWTIVDDPSLDGADSHEVRRRFLDWRAQSVAEEQGGPDDAAIKTAGASPRYGFAIQVDKDALHAVVHDALPPEEPDPNTKGWVRLIDAEWEIGAAASLRADLGNDRALSMALPCSDDLREHPAIEGVTTRLVGWIKIRYQHVQSEIYANSADRNWWVRVYTRPPEVLDH